MFLINRICPNCKTKNPDIATFCKDCGTRIGQNENPDPQSKHMENLKKSSKSLFSNIKSKVEDYQANERNKIEIAKEKIKENFLSGNEKMIIEIHGSGYSESGRAVATLFLGPLGYALTKGGQRTHKIKVKITDELLIVEGKISSEIKLLDINNTIIEKKSKLRINFKDGSFIHLMQGGGQLSRPEILNDMIQERIKYLQDKKPSNDSIGSVSDEI